MPGYDPSIAEEVVQEALLLALEGAVDLPRDPEDDLRVMCGVVRNCARNRRRREDVRAVEPLDHSGGEQRGSDGGKAMRQIQLDVEVADAVGHLSRRERAVVLLHVFEGLTHAEVAEASGFSRRTAERLWRTALRKLRERLGRNGKPV